MAYPDLPNNRLIVGGVDLTEKYGLILVDGYTLEAPEPKYYTVDIPGGDSVIDLTQSLAGDVVYERRKQTFTLIAIDVENYEELKTKVLNYLHGRQYNYRMTMDPGYIYTGRFKVTEYAHSLTSNGMIVSFTVEIDAEPYKRKDTITQAFNIAGGFMATFESGRKKVQPTFEFTKEGYVYFKGNKYLLQPGARKINNVWFTQGANEVYFAPTNLTSTVRYKDLEQFTWREIAETRRIFEWYNCLDKYEVTNATLVLEQDVTGGITFTASDRNGRLYTSVFDLTEETTKTVETTEKQMVRYDAITELPDFSIMDDYEDIDPDLYESAITDYTQDPTYHVIEEYDKPEFDEDGNPNLDRVVISIKEYYTDDDGNDVLICTWLLEDVIVETEVPTTVEHTLVTGDIIRFENDIASIDRYDSDGNYIGFTLPCVLPYSDATPIVSLNCDVSGTLTASYEEDKRVEMIQTKWGYYKQGGMEDTFPVGEYVDNPDTYETDERTLIKTINLETTWGEVRSKRWIDMKTCPFEYETTSFRGNKEQLCYVQYEWYDL